MIYRAVKIVDEQEYLAVSKIPDLPDYIVDASKR